MVACVGVGVSCVGGVSCVVACVGVGVSCVGVSCVVACVGVGVSCVGVSCVVACVGVSRVWECRCAGHGRSGRMWQRTGRCRIGPGEAG